MNTTECLRKYRNASKKQMIAIVLLVFIITLCFIIYYMNATKTHEYYCDGFSLHVDKKEIDLKQVNEDITSVFEILPITIMCRVDENTNYLLVYSFKKKDFIFSAYGSLASWVQDDLKSFLYLNKDIVYNMKGEIVYQAPKDKHIEMIEYIGTAFTVTITDLDYSNAIQVQVP